jgi:putative phosphoesterase
MTGGRVVIGLISDTHGLLRPEVATVFAGVDLIVHAGDVGGRAILESLSAIAPVEAVSGNVDDRFDPMLPRERTVPAGQLLLHVSHGDELGRPTPEALLARYSADLLIYGHTHQPLEYRAPDGRLVVNPGAAGPRRFKLQPSVAILTITGAHTQISFVAM